MLPIRRDIGPLSEPAGGAVRADAGFDDVLRIASGLVPAGCVDEVQRDRVLGYALDGIRG